MLEFGWSLFVICLWFVCWFFLCCLFANLPPGLVEAALAFIGANWLIRQVEKALQIGKSR